MYLEDALHALADLERTFAELESSDVFQAFTTRQKLEHRDVLGRLRDLIHDLEQDTAQEQLAS
jgi:hypothetical protein